MANQVMYPPLSALRAFEAVGRLRGIRRAAKELSVDHAVVSRHIRSLEASVGVQLVVRTGTGYELTELGETYHEQIASALNAIAGATGALTHWAEELRVRVECIPGFAFLWLSDHLIEFIAENPDIDVDFRPSDQSPDFRTYHVDADIRYLREWEKAGLSKAVKCLEFARPRVFPVASPAFAAALKPIAEATDLLTLPLLHEDNDLEWHHWFVGHDVTPPARLPGSRLWHAHLTLAAARQGHGIALANHMLLRDDLEVGRLVEIKPAESIFRPLRFGAYTFIARDDRWNSAAILRFRRWIQAAAKRYEVRLGQAT